jgi:hypothetical protein
MQKPNEACRFGRVVLISGHSQIVIGYERVLVTMTRRFFKVPGSGRFQRIFRFLRKH